MGKVGHVLKPELPSSKLQIWGTGQRTDRIPYMNQLQRPRQQH